MMGIRARARPGSLASTESPRETDGSHWEGQTEAASGEWWHAAIIGSANIGSAIIECAAGGDRAAGLGGAAGAAWIVVGERAGGDCVSSPLWLDFLPGAHRAVARP